MKKYFAVILRHIPFVLANSQSFFHMIYLNFAFPEIHLGKRVLLSDRCRLSATDGGEIHVGDRSSIEPAVTIKARGGLIKIDSECFIGTGTMIVALNRIEIGTKTLIGEFVTIRDQDHAFDGTSMMDMNCDPIVIGKGVWIGAKATITRGVKIGDNSVIGANAVVTHDVPNGTLAAGIPARVIRVLRDQ